MAAVKDVDAEFLRQRVRPMRSFAGDERVNAFRLRLLHAVARAAGDDADAFTDVAAAGDEQRLRADGALQASREFGAGNSLARLQTDRPAVARKKRAKLFQTQRRAQPRVVAELRMGVER